MAGSATTTLTFSTAVGGGVTEDSKEVSFKHTNPVVFNVTSDPLTTSGTITTSQKDIKLTATNVNIPWWGRLGTTGSHVESALPFTTPRTEDITVTVPARVWTDVSAWTGKVTVQAGYGAYNGVSAITTPVSYIFDRDAYTISVATPANIGYGGATFTVDVTTNAPGYTLDFMAGATKLTDVTGTGPVTAVASPSLTIPANTTTAARTINIVNHYDPTTTVASFTQAGVPKFALVGPYNSVPDLTDGSACPTNYHRPSSVVEDGGERTIMLSNGNTPSNGTYYFTTNNGVLASIAVASGVGGGVATYAVIMNEGDTNNPNDSSANGKWYIFCVRD
jgi:hypothetical protein